MATIQATVHALFRPLAWLHLKSAGAVLMNEEEAIIKVSRVASGRWGVAVTTGKDSGREARRGTQTTLSVKVYLGLFHTRILYDWLVHPPKRAFPALGQIRAKRNHGKKRLALTILVISIDCFVIYLFSSCQTTHCELDGGTRIGPMGLLESKQKPLHSAL